MSDNDFVDVGDELVVRVAGFPVGKAVVFSVKETGVACYMDDASGREAWFHLPLDFKDYDTVDGVAHETVNPSPCKHGRRYCEECHGDNFL